jgi:hypothetical protein
MIGRWLEQLEWNGELPEVVHSSARDVVDAYRVTLSPYLVKAASGTIWFRHDSEDAYEKLLEFGVVARKVAIESVQALQQHFGDDRPCDCFALTVSYFTSSVLRMEYEEEILADQPYDSLAEWMKECFDSLADPDDGASWRAFVDHIYSSRLKRLSGRQAEKLFSKKPFQGDE